MRGVTLKQEGLTMSLSFWNQRRRNAAAILRMQEEAAKEAEEAAKAEEPAEPEKPQTKRGRKNADSGADSKS